MDKDKSHQGLLEMLPCTSFNTQEWWWRKGLDRLFPPSFEKLHCCVSFYLMQKWQKEGGRRKASISDTTEGNMGGGWGGGLVVSGLWPFCAIWMVQKAQKQPEHLCYSLHHYDNENPQMLRGINNISSFLRLYKRNIYSMWKKKGYAKKYWS